MIKRIFNILILLLPVICFSQTNIQKVVVNGSIVAVIKYPADTSGGKKFPVMIYLGGNGTVGTDTSVIRNDGPFRQYQINPTGMANFDSMYIIAPVPSSAAQVMEFPVNIYAVMDAFDQLHHNSDTTNWMLWGISQGGTNTIETRAWPPSLWSGFGDPTNYRMNRFRIYSEASMCNLRGSNPFYLFAGKTVIFWHGSADGTCGVSNTNETYDSVSKYSGNTRKFILAGAGHSNTVWDSMTSPRGLDSVMNMYLLLQKKPGVGPPPPTDTLAVPLAYIDHSDYSTNDYNQAYNFSDGFGVWNPRTGVITDTTLSSNPKHGWWNRPGGPLKVNDYFVKDSSFAGIYYRGNRGPDIYMDFSNYSDMTDTSYQVTINTIYALTGEEVGHTAYFYRGDAILAMSRANRALAMARLDSVLTPFDSITTTSTIGELITKTLAHPVKTRWLIMRLTTSGSHISNFKELNFAVNTTTAYDTSKVRKEYTAALPKYQDSSHTFTKVNGINGFKGVSATDTKNYLLTRQFTGQGGYIDTSNVPGVSPHYPFWFAFTSDINVPYLQQIANNGGTLLITNQGSKNFNENHGYTYMAIDTPRVQDPELPTSYKNIGTLGFNLAAVFGKNVISSGRTRWTGMGIYTNGLNLPFRTPLGNESLDHGVTPRALYHKTSSVWDGAEGSLGSDIGIRSADTTFFVSPDATSSPDTNMIKVMVQMAQWTRADKKIPFNYIEYHKYFSNRDSSGQTFSLTEQVGQTSAALEWAYKKRGLNGITYWQQILRSTYKYTGVMPVYWTEYNMGNDSIPARNETEAGSIWDIYNTVPFGGLNNYQSKATILARYRLLIPFTGLSGACTYTLENSTNPPDTIVSALFASFGEVCCSSSSYPFPILTKYAAYFTNSCIAGRLNRYRADSSVIRIGGTDTTGIWKVKYRSVDNTDSICYAIWYASRSGQSLSQSVSVGTTTGNVEKLVPSFTSTTGTSSTLTPSGGNVTMTVTEIPTLLFAQEGTVSPPGCTTNSSPSNGSTIGTPTTATLVWNAASGATSYDVYIGGVFQVNTGSTSYGASGLSPSTSYSWYVVPRNSGGAATGCSGSATTFTTSTLPVPNCTTNTAPPNASTIGTQTTATLSWNSSATATGYKVYLYLNGGSIPGSPTYTTGSTSQGATGLTAAMTYKFFVVPYNGTGDAVGCSTSGTIFTTASLPPSVYKNLFIYMK